MSAGSADIARALRDAFDRSFADPVRPEPRRAGVLAIRVGGDPYAIRLADVAGLHRDKPVTPVASALPELLGLAGFRGAALPVYDLGALLGYPRAANGRWLVVATGSPAVAFAFDTFEAHLSVVLDTLVSEAGASARAHLDGALRGPDGVRALIRVASLVETIVSRARARSPVKER